MGNFVGKTMYYYCDAGVAAEGEATSRENLKLMRLSTGKGLMWFICVGPLEMRCLIIMKDLCLNL